MVFLKTALKVLIMATALAVGVTGAVVVKDQPAQAIAGTGV